MSVVEIFAFLELEQKYLFFKGLPSSCKQTGRNIVNIRVQRARLWVTPGRELFSHISSA
jgi:hypothetical protein